MAKPITRTLTVDTIERATASVNGNPAFYVTFTDGTRARTQSDADMAYGIENKEWRAVPLTVTFTPAGRIAFWEVAK